MNKKDLFGTSLVGEKKQKLILKGQWGLKNKYSPGGIKVEYQHSDLNKDIPEEFINPQPQMDYYAWWLDNRRKQLEQNMKDTGLYPDQNGVENLRNILNGYQPGRIALNKEIYNQLGRISDTIYEYDNTYNPILTINNGQYFKDKDGVPTVVIKRDLDKNKQYYTILHELVHNGNNPKQTISGVYDSDSATSPQEKKIKQIGVNVNKEYDDMIKNLPEYVDMLNYERTYLNTPSEIYARMMEFRKENNLNPNKKYSKEEIKKMIDKSKVSGIKAYDIEKLTKALNEVAQNNNLSKNYNFYAKQGGKMNIVERFKKGRVLNTKKYYDKSILYRLYKSHRES